MIEENGYEGKQCSQCGLIYISPRPSFEEIVDLYGHDEAHISAQSHISADFAKRLYAKHNLNIIRSVVNSGSLLEIGAGAGYFLDEARKIGFEPYGLEFNPVQANFMRNQLQIPCEQSPLSTSIFNGQKFDVIYHCDVISHFFDPIADFQKMNETMNDESFLIFETGNFAEVDQKYYQYIPSFQYPDHLFFFSVDNLAELLEKTGFQLIKIHRYSMLPQLLTMKVLSNIKQSIKKILIKSPDISSKPGKSTSEPYETNKTSISNFKSSNIKSSIKKNIKNIYNFGYHYFNYLLRYKIGKLAPKAQRPQTVIVIAKKVKSVAG
ncbi:class I SAM-dependent methyltransferase [Pleurocapsa sp. PCC 7319]|uniref:class I SAM-dependent methyltransferase n=1 Tax=Pleurocapsa sp. PCC 7319 TaxID=118161 RepID=UPI001ED98583|nr:class I SAM-dependent methyltransferase [Pleurocapsa sp. PCC 7319]